MVKILKRVLINSSYWKPVRGGISTYVESVYEILKEHYTIFLLAWQGESNIPDIQATNTGKVSHLISGIAAQLAFKPDIIHTHGPWYIILPAAIHKTLYPKTRLVHTFHTNPQQKYKMHKRIIMRFMLSRYDSLVFVGQSLKEHFSYLKLQPHKIEVIPVAARKFESTKKEKKEIIRETGIGKGKIISCISNLAWPGKVEGIKILLNSMKIVLNRHPDANLVLLGDGKYMGEMKQRVKSLGIEKKVHLLGHKSYVGALLEMSTIYVHASLQEGSPLAIVEAMSMGAAVITFDLDWAREVIKDRQTGILCEARPDKLANAIIECLGNHQVRKRIARNSHELVMRQYQWKTVAGKYAELYEK